MNITRDTCIVHMELTPKMTTYEIPRAIIREDYDDHTICYLALFIQMTVSSDYRNECVIHSEISDIATHPWRTDYE